MDLLAYVVSQRAVRRVRGDEGGSIWHGLELSLPRSLLPLSSSSWGLPWCFFSWPGCVGSGSLVGCVFVDVGGGWGWSRCIGECLVIILVSSRALDVDSEVHFDVGHEVLILGAGVSR